MNRIVRCVSLPAIVGLIGVSCGGGGGGDKGTGIVKAPAVLSVTVSPKNPPPIDPTDNLQLSVSVETRDDASNAVNWSSSSNAIATVTSTGQVTAVAQGTATITATSSFNPNRSDNATVIVNPARVTGVTLSTGDRTLPIRQNFTLTGNVESKGTVVKTILFTAAPSGIVTLTPAGDGVNVTVLAVTAGQTTITAASVADQSLKKSVVITVTGTVAIQPIAPINLIRGQTTRIVPSVQPDPGVSPTVTFSSGNTAIATVSGDGTVTTLGLGQTTITVTSVGDPTVKLPVQLTVRSGVTSVTLTTERDSVRPTRSKQLSADVQTEIPLSKELVWSSANTSVVTVNASTGAITGVTPGQAYVRALSALDAGVGDSTLAVVVNPCFVFPRLVVGTPVSSAINDGSCNGLQETFDYRITTAGVYRLTTTFSFPAFYVFFATKTDQWGLGFSPSTVEFPMVLAPADYNVILAAGNVANRGSFTMALDAAGPTLAPCLIGVSTGVSLNTTLAADGCATYQPPGRPAGTYYARRLLLLPYLRVGQPLTVTVSNANFVPVIDVVFKGVQAQQQVGAGTSATLTFNPPSEGYVQINVSSRDAAVVGNFAVSITGPAPSVGGAATSPGVALPTVELPSIMSLQPSKLTPITLVRP